MYLCVKRGALEHTGRLSGVFLLGYAAARGFVECFREPDAFLGTFAGGISMGQILCLPMAVAGFFLIARSRRTA